MDSKLQGIPETMLIPLWAKAHETQKPDGIIKDNKAVEIVSCLDYDFSIFESAWLSQFGVAVRTMLFDEEVKKFITKHDGNCIIINLGSGLDTRYERMGNDKIKWYDIDVPEGIELRRKFFKENENLKFISGSVFNYRWFNEIDIEDKPVLFIAEGLLMYFHENEIKSLFRKIIDRFPNGEILFEMLAPMLVGKSAKHDALKKMDNIPEFKWSLRNIKTMEKWDHRIRYINEFDLYDFHKKKWKWFGYIGRFFLVRPYLSNRIVHIQFDG